jgi:hypothetical protein
VRNVQGYGGTPEEKKLNEVQQVALGNTVCLYQKTPSTTIRDD